MGKNGNQQGTQQPEKPILKTYETSLLLFKRRGLVSLDRHSVLPVVKGNLLELLNLLSLPLVWGLRKLHHFVF